MSLYLREIPRHVLEALLLKRHSVDEILRLADEYQSMSNGEAFTEPVSETPDDAVKQPATPLQSSARPDAQNKHWTCSKCTFVNDASIYMYYCKMCHSTNPSAVLQVRSAGGSPFTAPSPYVPRDYTRPDFSLPSSSLFPHNSPSKPLSQFGASPNPRPGSNDGDRTSIGRPELPRGLPSPVSNSPSTTSALGRGASGASHQADGGYTSFQNMVPPSDTISQGVPRTRLPFASSVTHPAHSDTDE